VTAAGPHVARRIVFVGPPGAGKGTQAAALARELGVAHLSTGDLLRAAVAEGSDLGRAADGHIRAGRLVPDELVLDILGERLQRPDAAVGFILDGYPRNLSQARALERLTPLDLVVSRTCWWGAWSAGGSVRRAARSTTSRRVRPARRDGATGTGRAWSSARTIVSKRSRSGSGSTGSRPRLCWSTTALQDSSDPWTRRGRRPGSPSSSDSSS
jgi:adenylate kinase family enzyme